MSVALSMPTRFHFWRALLRFLQGNSMTYAAAIAYYTLFSFFPLILILLSVSGVFIGRFKLENPIVESVRFYLPVGADLIENNLRTITASGGSVSLLALCLLVWTASGAFVPLELALNHAWGSQEGTRVHSQTDRCCADGLAEWLLHSGFGLHDRHAGPLRQFLTSRIPQGQKSGLDGNLFEVLFVLVSFLVAVGMFALIYKIVPYTRFAFLRSRPQPSWQPSLGNWPSMASPL